MLNHVTLSLMAFVFTLVAIAPLDAAEPRPSGVTATQLEGAPLTLSVSQIGRFSKGSSWHLSVNSAGQAELTVDTFPKRTRRRLLLSNKQLAEFRTALIEARFFDLESQYGQRVHDGSESTLTVTAGRHANTTRVYFLMNWINGDRSKLEEPSRAVRLLVMVRSWFDEPEAVDLREYDRMVLEAAEG
ncbi:hypothetical protein Pla123a_02320 [Posidoniimonas polymericola]|uniref:Uncharacterized protein n=1 Tax=Posidoniimonas polymericola TaxID=2528002 RepID=A0A5C5ZE31_9BACT|nr:hypothetical protein [Posidoniimonas polymericola]TWT85425.1 hypothetical protein Pla123a_02320 [Posidoniimonas polymericola]